MKKYEMIDKKHIFVMNLYEKVLYNMKNYLILCYLLCASEFHCDVDNLVWTILAHPSSDCHILLALEMDPLPCYRLPICRVH